MKRKYFSFPNEVETPEMEDKIEAAMECIMDDAYYFINDDDHGADTIYACDAAVETPPELVPYMYYSESLDAAIDKEVERRREAYAKQQAAKAKAEVDEYDLYLRLKAKYE